MKKAQDGVFYVCMYVFIKRPKYEIHKKHNSKCGWSGRVTGKQWQNVLRWNMPQFKPSELLVLALNLVNIMSREIDLPDCYLVIQW